MVRPTAFRANEQTAVNNFFQNTSPLIGELNTSAQEEFDHLVKTLQKAGIEVIISQDNGIYDTPDSIFPNNVISFHQDTAIIYPMFAPNRRRERLLNHLDALEKRHIHFPKIKDYSQFENQNLFLEGTGVLVLDRINMIAYCSISDRAHLELLALFCEENNYKPVVFHATHHVNNQRQPIYHTNVMMALGSNFCVICLKSIVNEKEKNNIISQLENTGKKIIDISENQMNQFCGNILELQTIDDKKIICMSKQAYDAFNTNQKEQLSSIAEIIYAPIYTIEKYGGGSVRCMIAEVFT